MINCADLSATKLFAGSVRFVPKRGGLDWVENGIDPAVVEDRRLSLASSSSRFCASAIDRLVV